MAKFLLQKFAIFNMITDWVKQAAHQRGKSLRAASFSKLDNKVNIFATLLVHTATSTVSKTRSKIRFYTSVNFHLPFPPLLVHKIILTIPTNTPFLYTSAIFNLPIFSYNHSNNLNEKYFPFISYLANSGCV